MTLDLKKKNIKNEKIVKKNQKKNLNDWSKIKVSVNKLKDPSGRLVEKPGSSFSSSEFTGGLVLVN